MEKNTQKITRILELLPDRPGVYLMKNESQKIIYVGKAKSLRSRVRSYFSGTPTDPKTQELVSRIKDLEYIITKTEGQALELEANLIKKHKPRYNISLKDDKRYPFIKVTLNEKFPRIFVTRRLLKDRAKYFGPYTDAKSVRHTLKMMEWIFPLRTCKRDLENKEYKRACINYQLGKCTAPCIGKISETEYNDIVKNAIRFLKGRNQEIISELKIQMEKFAASLEFEKAAKVRDKLRNLQHINRHHNIFFTDQKDRDVISIYQEDKRVAVSVLKILAGKLLNKEIYELENTENSILAELMEAFVKQYYSQKLHNLPYSILLQIEPSDFHSLQNWLQKKLIVPKRGEKKILLTIARENAYNYLEEQKLKHLRKSNRTIFPIKELKDKLHLKSLPRKMICLDISTIQGSDTVASAVYFENGKPKKSLYRHFIIKSLQKQNDFAAMQETLERYLKRIDEQTKPDLIVIDGGKGQLNSANFTLQKFPKWEIEIISLAKRMEEIFLPKKNESILLPRNSSALRLLIKIRDEAHRFAITFHRKKRNFRTLQSDLDKVKGIGDKTKFLLLKEFGSIEKIKKLPIEELTKIKGIGKQTAINILDKLNEKKV